jgi:hypothetical protein
MFYIATCLATIAVLITALACDATMTRGCLVLGAIIVYAVGELIDGGRDESV